MWRSDSVPRLSGCSRTSRASALRLPPAWSLPSGRPVSQQDFSTGPAPRVRVVRSRVRKSYGVKDMSNNIKGKVIVITGASSGLGEATARLLSKEGAKVVLGARRADRLKSLADEVT